MFSVDLLCTFIIVFVMLVLYGFDVKAVVLWIGERNRCVVSSSSAKEDLINVEMR